MVLELLNVCLWLCQFTVGINIITCTLWGLIYKLQHQYFNMVSVQIDKYSLRLQLHVCFCDYFNRAILHRKNKYYCFCPTPLNCLRYFEDINCMYLFESIPRGISMLPYSFWVWLEKLHQQYFNKAAFNTQQEAHWSEALKYGLLVECTTEKRIYSNEISNT